jgi:hypothetical protein
MRQVRTESLTAAEANAELGVSMDTAFWAALVRLIAYPEVMWDARTSRISFPDYVPFLQLAQEWIDGIEEGLYDIRQCLRCNEYLDVGQTGGIFGLPADLEEFICMPCAERMSAREYFERFIERKDV